MSSNTVTDFKSMCIEGIAVGDRQVDVRGSSINSPPTPVKGDRKIVNTLKNYINSQTFVKD